MILIQKNTVEEPPDNRRFRQVSLTRAVAVK
jgi:hypothetical protein